MFSEPHVAVNSTLCARPHVRCGTPPYAHTRMRHTPVRHTPVRALGTCRWTSETKRIPHGNPLFDGSVTITVTVTVTATDDDAARVGEGLVHLVYPRCGRACQHHVSTTSAPRQHHVSTWSTRGVAAPA